MSIHIDAPKGAIADRVLLPGDPLRAKFIAETFLKDVVQYNQTRNMFGFTGTTPDGRRISVQGTGMGIPSLSIYVNELIDFYGAKELIRVGTCGGLHTLVRVRDIIIAQGACTDSNVNRRRFSGLDFAPIASWRLLYNAFNTAKNQSIPVRVGNVLSADLFYNEHFPLEYKMWADYNVLGIEMECTELYTLAAKKGVEALSILTVSDNLVTQEFMSSLDRERTLLAMAKIAIYL